MLNNEASEWKQSRRFIFAFAKLIPSIVDESLPQVVLHCHN